MNRLFRHAWSALLVTLLVVGAAHAQSGRPFDAPSARIARGAAGQPLVQGANGDAIATVHAYLRSAGHAEATVGSLVLARRETVARTGVTHLRFTQRVGGLDVYGTYVKASLDAQGSLTTVIENLAEAGPVAAAGLGGGEGRALAIGLQHVHGNAANAPGLLRREGNTSVFARTPFFHREPTVTTVAVPVGNGLRAGYLVETWTESGNALHHTLVGGDGAVLGDENRTASDRYNVFRQDPEASQQRIELGPGAAGNAWSPIGWLGTGAQTSTNIAGNNVQAYLDVNANNAPDSGGSAVANGDFLTPWSSTTQPSTTSNREVATQNLFYLNNVTHDLLYQHGFTEIAGNFQEDNFGKGGAGSDGVLAEVQDGSGTDNANFATPADGSNPRMQMYVWLGLGNAEVVAPRSSGGTASYVAQTAGFGPAPSAAGTTAPLAVGGDGCARYARNALAGSVAIIDRGSCDFTVKVTNAQRAGAAAVIVANNAATAIFSMGGTANTTIPAVMVSQSDGAALKAVVGQNGTVRDATTDPLNRDSSLDSDIVYHEYGHGLTWRMIGSMSGAMSGAIGEGMSDVLAVLINGNDVVGEYAGFDDAGIRTEPYANYSRTYSDFGGTEVHLDGEIYGAIGWRLGETFRNDLGTLLDYIVDGMNYTPAGPAFEDMRDGILDAIAATPGAPANHQCLVWEAFAEYGVGVGADAVVRGRGLSITESFALPNSCQ
jgi:extracellular elastinolytic metalloproteinase